MKKKFLFQRLAMLLPELEAYYHQKRKEDYDCHSLTHDLTWRKRIHGLVLLLLKLNSIFIGHRITVLHGRHTQKNVPTIYACTHVGRYDIETTVQLIGRQCRFFMGDPGAVYQNFDGLILWLNGTIFTDTAFDEDRHIGKENCISVLEHGSNILIYPEGAWNITENLPVMKLFDGTSEMAIRTGARIVPIAIEKYDRHYFANVGKEIDPSGYSLSDKKALTSCLRDKLCGLKWDIWEAQGITSRTALPPDAAQQYLADIMAESENGYTLEEIERTRYHDKTGTSPQEVFAHLDKLIPRRENAFLFRKQKII